MKALIRKLDKLAAERGRERTGSEAWFVVSRRRAKRMGWWYLEDQAIVAEAYAIFSSHAPQMIQASDASGRVVAQIKMPCGEYVSCKDYDLVLVIGPVD